MSHAACLVAIDPVELELTKGDIEKAVDWQMEPFKENDAWFEDGSRWDWYVIGGRFTGSLDGYDPETDKRNYKTCEWCEGSGHRRDMAIANLGCNGCSGTGRARKFHNVGHNGDIQLRSAIDLTKLYRTTIESRKKVYQKAMADTNLNARDIVYGVQNSETLETYLERKCPNPAASIAHMAFLRNRHWHEPERMGWFGGTTATECERKAESSDIEAMIRRCKYKDPKTGACCVSWNEPWEIWSVEFWKRFVEPLQPETVLVTVDYHV